MFKYNVGIDWADDHHDICIVDSMGKESKRFSIAHNSKGFKSLIEVIESLEAKKSELAFVLETNQGLLVDFLLNSGYTVYPINPRSAERFRDRHGTSGKKDDSFDAFSLADALRTDSSRWTSLHKDSSLARKLKVLVQDREHLIQAKSKVVNQLIRCLKDYYPIALDIFSDLQSSISLAFLEAYPNAYLLKKMTRKEFKRFLDKHNYPWNIVNKTLNEFFHEIQQSPKLNMPVDDVVVETKSRFMLSLLEQLKTLVDQVKQYDDEIKRLMKNHPDNDIFRSLPGAGDKTVSKLAAHLGEDRDKYKNFRSVQRVSGTAPITKQSGNYKNVHARWLCQQDFRNTLVRYAFVSMKKCVWARSYYDQKRKNGATHAGALRILANKWAKIIYTLWKKRICYQEEVFLASKQQHALLNAS